MLITQNLNAIQSFSGIVNPNYILGTIISKPLPFVFAAAGIALLIYLVLGGLEMMTSKGDPKAIQSAQGKITNAILGFVIIIIAYSVVQVVGKILGLDVFSGIFGGATGTKGVSK